MLELQGVDFKNIPCMVDLRAALKFLNTTIDNVPCLIALRGGGGGDYIANQNRFTSVLELGRLQGWKSNDIKNLLKSGESERQVGKALGNG
eukprot:9399497-Lingulodinium_polyedra.AAC.1